MRRISLIILMLSATLPSLSAQNRFREGRLVVENGEEIYEFTLRPIFIYAQAKDQRQFDRLMYNVLKVYPVAKEAEAMLADIEVMLGQIKTSKGQKQYVKNMEKELTDKYTPVLKKMTFSQGKILIKLIDRQTDRTGYALVKELRGGFKAGLYQGIARIFGANLKDTYDQEGEDKMIEEIIEMIEQGII